MGIKLVEHVMDHAPDTLTTGEWKALIVLAQDANEATRITYRGVNDPKILRRVRLAPNAWANVRAALVKKGCLEVYTPAKRGQAAKYRIPVLSSMGHPTGDPLPESETAMSHPTGDETGEYGHPAGEAKPEWVTQQVIPTPPSSSTTSSSAPADPPASPEPPGGGGGDREQLLRAQVFVASLDYGGQRPGTGPRDRLVKLVDAALAAGWTEQALRQQLDLGGAAIKSRIAIYLHRLAPDNLPEPVAEQRASPRLPDWCGTCNDSDPAARFNPKFRYRHGQMCHCHPDHKDVAA